MGNSNKHQRNIRLSLVSQMMHAMGDGGFGQSNAIIASAKKLEDYINGVSPIVAFGFTAASEGDSMRFEEPSDTIVMKHTGIRSGSEEGKATDPYADRSVRLDRDDRNEDRAFQGIDNRDTGSLSGSPSARSLSATEAKRELEKIEQAEEEHKRRLSQCRMIFSQGVSTALITKSYGPQMDIDRIIERIVRVMNTGIDDTL